MTGLEAWIADCHLQDRESDPPQDYTCQVAVWADGYDMFRARLAAYLEATAYRILWVEECLEALEYVKRHGQQARVGALARAVHLGHPVEMGRLTAKNRVEENHPEQTLSFREALLALDYKTTPVFAVLDGAQFDNLPEALFDGDFISRPLYLDRGENDPEQIVTAPHMVTLDERTQLVTGRSYEDTLEALLSLVGEKPAAVFWQCPDGGEALYKHLRGINKIMIPKKALQQDGEVDAQALNSNETHIMVLFRHADANALAQTLYALAEEEVARLYGPSTMLLFSPDPDWAEGNEWLRANKEDEWSRPKRGPLRLCLKTMDRINDCRLKRRQRLILRYLKNVAPAHTKNFSDEKLDEATAKYIKEAESYGVLSDAALGKWCYLQIMTDGQMGKQADITEFISKKNPGHDPNATPDERIKTLMQMTIAQLEGLGR